MREVVEGCKGGAGSSQGQRVEAVELGFLLKVGLGFRICAGSVGLKV